MIPCRYCGGTPELRHHRAEFTHFTDDSYMVVCKDCGARTNSHPNEELVKLQWDRECVMRLVTEDETQRYIEIDGKRVEVESCRECPCYSEVDKDGKGPWCKHPVNYAWPREGHRYGKYCPLRKVDG